MTFSFYEILVIIGLLQSLSILVFLLSRAGSLTNTRVAAFFFGLMTLIFAVDYAVYYLQGLLPFLAYGQLFLWFLLIPASVLVVHKVLLVDVISPRFIWGMMLGYAAVFMLAMAFAGVAFSCSGPCDEMRDSVQAACIIATSLFLLTLWQRRDMISSIYESTMIHGAERYWLVVCLVLLCCGVIGLSALRVFDALGDQDYMAVRTVLGLTFVYIAGTSFFRIYPQAVHSVANGGAESARPQALTDDEKGIAERIASLLKVEKVYQEASYGRENLAKELKINEAILSRIVNLYFDKSIPQLLNEYRVEDAKRLLKETDAPIRVIAEEAGFNSIPTFNRVFKEMAGVSPTDFRSGGK